MIQTIIVAAALLAAGEPAPTPAAATASPTAQTADAMQASTPAPASKICKTVVAAEANAKPYELCLSKAAWAAKEQRDAQDATRNVCHYIDQTGGKFKGYKVCMPASEWENQKLRDREWLEKGQASSQNM